MNKWMAALVSLVTRKPVFIGNGSTADSKMKFSEETMQKARADFGGNGAVKHITYVSKDKTEVGEFRLINLSRKIDKQVHYQLKHMPTGKVYNLPKNLFELLFERK